MIHFGFTQLSIIVHKNCNHSTVETLASDLKKIDLKYFCGVKQEENAKIRVCVMYNYWYVFLVTQQDLFTCTDEL